jgi:hypothetical protein
MAGDQSHTEQGQVERAKRLRERIDQLQRGQSAPGDSKKDKSLKEQIDERAREQNG